MRKRGCHQVPGWPEDGWKGPRPGRGWGTAVTSCMTGSSSSLAILGGSQPRGPWTRSARRARGLDRESVIQPAHLGTHSASSPALGGRSLKQTETDLISTSIVESKMDSPSYTPSAKKQKKSRQKPPSNGCKQADPSHHMSATPMGRNK